MNSNDNQLNNLFNTARNQEPVASFEETTRAFAVASVTAAGGVLATKGLLKLLTLKKWIIMFSTIAVITTTTLVISLNTSTHTEESTLNELAVNEVIIESPKEQTNVIPSALDEKSSLIAIASIDESVTNGTDEQKLDQTALVTKVEELEVSSPLIIIQKQVEDTIRAEIIPYSARFDITEKTTDAEFAAIKKQAQAAGIKFDYSAKHKKGELKKLKYTMHLKDGGGEYDQYVRSTVSISGEFAYTLAWATNDDGAATQIYCGETENFDENLTGDNLIIDLENLPDLDLLFAQMDSIEDHIGQVLETDLAELQENLKEIQFELEETIDELEQNEMQALQLELKSISEELTRVLKEEMDAIEIILDGEVGAEQQEEGADEQEEGAEQEEGKEEGSEKEKEESSEEKNKNE